MMPGGIDIVLSEIAVIRAAFTRLETALEALRQTEMKVRLSELPLCDVPITEHRREHRAGPVPKIAADPELQAFILARSDRPTFQQIADDIAAHFPPERRVRRSAIHDWYMKTTQPDRQRRTHLPRTTPRHPG